MSRSTAIVLITCKDHNRKPRIGILVSQYDHRLADVLQRNRRGGVGDRDSG